ncbi:MAG: heavy metal translocating P-type ATPase [Longimicrobiales bacterium]
MTERLRLDLALLLPDVPDARDACVRRLEEEIGGKQGVLKSHVVSEAEGDEAVLCLHYDPELLSIREVERIAVAAGARLTKKYGHAVLPIRAIAGEDAARRIEADLRALDGVIVASVNLAAQRIRVEFDRDLASVDSIRGALRGMGYVSAEPSTPEAGPACCRPKEPVPEDAGWYARNKELVWSLIAGALLLSAWGGERWMGLPAAGAITLYIISYGFGGFDLVRHWVGSLRRGRISFDIDLLMLLAAIGAAILGEWAEGAFLLFLFSLAHALEHYALGRARNAIRALADLAPATARVMRDERQVEVPVEEVSTGDIVVVRPAERIPVDGEVKSGESAVNQAPITGESMPVEKAPGDEVFAGTINGDGALQIVTTRAAGDRTLDRVVQLVEEAQTQKAPTQRFTERFERIFVPAVLLADLLLIVLPPLIGFWDWGTSFYRGMALLVASSPCALALGTPSAVLAGIAQAARNGVLIKGGAHLENLGTLRAVAFDKTGTLTVGEPQVTDAVPAAGVQESDLLAIAAAVERHSQHPLAEAVVRHAESRSIDIPAAGDLESITARGVRSTVAGRIVEIGNLRLWEEQGTAVQGDIEAAVGRLQQEGRSTMAVRHGEQWLGVIGVADCPREHVSSVLQSLRDLGIQSLTMLTGDNRGVGEAIAREVGVDSVRAELLPEDKVAAIKELLREHGPVAMVGDGVNDAPALANATVGIAMGGAGTAVALETADVALMGDDLGRLPFAVGLSRKARSIIRQNLYISLAVIAILIVATTTGMFGIGPAVLVHEGSTLVVIANALRLLTYRTPCDRELTRGIRTIHVYGQ